MVVEFIEKFYDIDLEQEHLDTIHSLTPFKYSPAEITKVMFENFDSYVKCIEQLKNI